MIEVEERSGETPTFIKRADYNTASKKKHLLKILVSRYIKRMKKDLHNMIAIVGEPGSGKSTLAMQIALGIEKHFGNKFDPKYNVVWTLEDLLDRLIEARKRAFVFEEAGIEIYSRNFMTKLNKIMSFIAQSYRFTANTIVFNLPHIRMIDLDIRVLLQNVLLTARFEQAINGSTIEYFAFYPWRYQTFWVDDGIWRVPDTYKIGDGNHTEMGWIAFDPLPEELYAEYEKLKVEWFRKRVQEWKEEKENGKGGVYKTRLGKLIKWVHDKHGVSYDEIAQVIGYASNASVIRLASIVE
jgi:energy-coupling factor transporter ATP-binding protein EcfA2